MNLKERINRRQAKNKLKIALNKYDFLENPYQLNVLDRVKEAQIRRRAPKLPRKCFEYSQQYDIVLPGAPALRSLPRKTVDSLVNRLYPFSKVTGRAGGVNNDNEELSTLNNDHGRKMKMDCSKHSYRKCSYCDSNESIFDKRNPSTKTPKQVQEMIDRLSVVKLHDSDFRFGKLIRFRNVRSLNEYEDSPSHFQSMTSLTSGLSDTKRFKNDPSQSASLDKLYTKLPPINRNSRKISKKGENGLKITVTMKNKSKSNDKIVNKRLVKSSSLKRHDVNVQQSARSIQSF